jgi:opacity protein-like surface antigen
MKYTTLAFLFLFFTGTVFSQDGEKTRSESSGLLEIGLRNTTSLFGNDGHVGMGVGGQFRLRISDRLNTEFFADYITTDVGGLGRRTDGHIGWSVMFYPFEVTDKVVTPYILAGHCFDYTKVSPNSTIYQDRSDEARDRWSSAVQMGLGTNFNLSDKANLSLSAQYMMHLGEDIHSSIDDHCECGIETLEVTTGSDDGHDDHSHSGTTLEGHVFITLSLNIKIADLW